MPDRLRPLWNFDDLDASEERLREQLEREETDAGRAEVLTPLARVEGLRSNFDASEGLLQKAERLAGSSALAKVRIDLEGGRTLRSRGNRGLRATVRIGVRARMRARPILPRGRRRAALEAFQRALEARERDPENQQAIAWAREAVAEAQRKLAVR